MDRYKRIKSDDKLPSASTNKELFDSIINRIIERISRGDVKYDDLFGDEKPESKPIVGDVREIRFTFESVSDGEKIKVREG